VGASTRSASASTSDASPPLGVYLHVPFCARRCDYCAFATWTDRDHLVEPYLAALEVELQAAVEGGWFDGTDGATSVFVGGGTPSLVPAWRLVEVLDRVPRAPRAEVTVECNPDTVDRELLATYRRGPVTRLSFGVQSMVPHVLEALGRTHDPDAVRRAVRWARAEGFDDLNLDLIYGGAGESLDDWATTLEQALELEPDHVSAYALTVEPGTPLADDPSRHPDDDDQADKYELAEGRLTDAGYEWYEISNWARPGRACRHNQLYWRQGDYLGVGCAAHSHRAGRRWWNVRSVDRYVERVQSGRSPEAGAEVLEADTRRIEGLQLALRTREGVPEDALPLDAPELVGLVERDGSSVRLTTAGRLLANEVAVRLR
jgi:oxygen-independent coproporphyrinogen-3 oxidase